MSADPFFSAGDVVLRHDIQTLADYGIIGGPVTSWPLAWEAIAADVEEPDDARPLPRQVRAALERVRDRMRRERRGTEVKYRARLSAAGEPMRVRGFANTPRESGEIGFGISWIGDRAIVQLDGQVVTSPDDDKEFRADGSLIGLMVGNYSIAASTMDRWWGPGWDGSLILSSNARPIPALTVDRSLTEAFDTKWLSWLGPWDLSVMFGQMESGRAVPDAQFFGLRFNFRPLRSLEIGLSRTAQWCGEGRPCGFDTFTDLLLGRDNRGDDGIAADDEPGNQLAGIDFRWGAVALPFSAYGQFIGEDEAGGFPSQYLGQIGIETAGRLGEDWSFRWFGEIADTTCRFYGDDHFNCAYNHGIYSTGYRYRGRAVGHGTDNDARIVSSGMFLVDGDETRWQAVVRFGVLNRDGPPDARHSLTVTKQQVMSIDFSHGREFRFGTIEIGAGLERIEDSISGHSDREKRAFVRWRTSR